MQCTVWWYPDPRVVAVSAPGTPATQGIFNRSTSSRIVFAVLNSSKASSGMRLQPWRSSALLQPLGDNLLNAHACVHVAVRCAAASWASLRESAAAIEFPPHGWQSEYKREHKHSIK
jgi:hypothetical protein